jgi:hypothetical protein
VAVLKPAATGGSISWSTGRPGWLTGAQERGETAVVVAVDGKAVGTLSLDTIRPQPGLGRVAQARVEHVVMLTGDNPGTAKSMLKRSESKSSGGLLPGKGHQDRAASRSTAAWRWSEFITTPRRLRPRRSGSQYAYGLGCCLAAADSAHGRRPFEAELRSEARAAAYHCPERRDLLFIVTALVTGVFAAGCRCSLPSLATRAAVLII